ncbi:21097_t:CDS:2, partial [Racocetra persica]
KFVEKVIQQTLKLWSRIISWSAQKITCTPIAWMEETDRSDWKENSVKDEKESTVPDVNPCLKGEKESDLYPSFKDVAMSTFKTTTEVMSCYIP